MTLSPLDMMDFAPIPGHIAAGAGAGRVLGGCWAGAATILGIQHNSPPARETSHLVIQPDQCASRPRLTSTVATRLTAESNIALDPSFAKQSEG
jgi:hypothetical protein